MNLLVKDNEINNSSGNKTTRLEELFNINNSTNDNAKPRQSSDDLDKVLQYLHYSRVELLKMTMDNFFDMCPANFSETTNEIKYANQLSTIGAERDINILQSILDYNNGEPMFDFIKGFFDPTFSSDEYEGEGFIFSQEVKLNGKSFDIGKAIAALQSNCYKNLKAGGSKPPNKSIGRCAQYVRTAMEAGGLNTKGRPMEARNYWRKNFMAHLGFGMQDKSTYRPKAGDVYVMDYTPYGHIAMYDGTTWISDFKQHSVLVGKPSDTPVAYFRFGCGYNGNLLKNAQVTSNPNIELGGGTLEIAGDKNHLSLEVRRGQVKNYGGRPGCFGQLFVNGKYFCDCAERATTTTKRLHPVDKLFKIVTTPQQGNTKTSRADWMSKGNSGNPMYQFAKLSNGFIPQIQGTGASGIRIHQGTGPMWSEGCLVIGKQKDGKFSPGTSLNAWKSLYAGLLNAKSATITYRA